MPIKEIKVGNKKTYAVKVNYTDKETGEYKRKSKYGFALKSEAIAYEAQLRMMLANNFASIEDSISLKDTVKTEEKQEIEDTRLFRELWKMFYEMKQPSLKESTKIKYKRAYEKHIEPFFGSKLVGEIEAVDIDAWRKILVDKGKSYKLSIKTVNNYRTLLYEVFDYAIQIYRYRYNPVSHVKNYKYQPPIKKQYTASEFAQFVSVIEHPMYNLLFKMLFLTGLRKGELLALRYRDLLRNGTSVKIDKSRTYENNVAGTYSISTPKNNTSVRTIAIEKNVYQQFLEYYAQQKKIDGFTEDWYIFGGPTIIGNETLRRHNKKYAEIAGLHQIRIHDFRGSCASFILNQTKDIMVAKNQLGHSSAEVTLKHYLKETPGALESAMENISTALENANIFTKLK